VAGKGGAGCADGHLRQGYCESSENYQEVAALGRLEDECISMLRKSVSSRW
jgi:hypothetical protein